MVLTLARSDQVDRVVAFGRERRGLESSYHRPTSPFVIPYLAAVSFLKDDLHCYFINKENKR